MDSWFGMPETIALLSRHIFGELIYACCDELRAISFIEFLCRVLTLNVGQLQELNTFCEKTIQMFFAILIEAALSSADIAQS
jgi:hypothetical protein